MRIEHSYELLLNIPFNDKSVLKIIEKGQELGLSFFYWDDYCADWNNLNLMNKEQTLAKINRDSKEPSEDYNYPSSIAIRYEGTDFSMNIDNKKNNVFIHIYPVGLWYKKFGTSSYDYTDLTRYIELLITLANNYPILSIETNMLPDGYQTKVNKNACKIAPYSSFNETSIMKIIEKGQKLGFRYLNQKNYTDQLDSLSVLNNKDVLKKIMAEELFKKTLKTNEKKSTDFLLPSNIVVHYENTFFSLAFTQEDINGLYIELLPLKNFWFIKNDTSSVEYIDIGRYLKLLIQLCEDFPCDDIRASTL